MMSLIHCNILVISIPIPGTLCMSINRGSNYSEIVAEIFMNAALFDVEILGMRRMEENGQHMLNG